MQGLVYVRWVCAELYFLIWTEFAWHLYKLDNVKNYSLISVQLQKIWNGIWFESNWWQTIDQRPFLWLRILAKDKEFYFGKVWSIWWLDHCELFYKWHWMRSNFQIIYYNIVVVPLRRSNHQITVLFCKNCHQNNKDWMNHIVVWRHKTEIWEVDNRMWSKTNDISTP